MTKYRLGIWIGLALLASATAQAKTGIFPVLASSDSRSHSFAAIDHDTAAGSAKPFSKLDFQSMEDWKSETQVRLAFERVRDHRIYPDVQKRSFLRRITWLYKSDGCFQRAGSVAQQLIADGFPSVKQIFIFSHITNEWNYHIATVARVGSKIYVFDAALDAKAPLELSKWLGLFSDSSPNLLANLCDATTWEPNSNCTRGNFDAPDADMGKTLKEWREYFMPLERSKFGEDADRILGESPPWRTAIFF